MYPFHDGGTIRLFFIGKLSSKQFTHLSLVSVNFDISKFSKARLPRCFNMASLAEQLRSLSTPEPSRFDLDDDEFDVTRAQAIDKGDEDGDIESETVTATSDLRKKTAPLLQDVDKKYAGRKVSRAQIEALRSHHIEDSVRGEESELENDSEGTEQINCCRNAR